jgi:hypothetical protein
MKQKIPLSLLEFVQTGRFGGVEIGQSRAEIRAFFPEPDEEYQSNYDGVIVWCYGVLIEFLFEDDKLHTIFSDSFCGVGNKGWVYHKLRGGPALRLDRWIFSKPKRLTLPYVMEALVKNGIDFVLKNRMDASGNCYALELGIPKSGVGLHFDRLEEKHKNLSRYTCVAFFKTAPFSPQNESH